MLAQNVRPKFKADACYISVHDGIYLRSNSNRLVLKGKSLYHLLEHLVPHLDGNVTLEEITKGLDEGRKRMVTNLIEKLFAHHFLEDAGQHQSYTLSPEQLATYSSDITFIESFQASAASRFERFRHQRLLIIGSGHSGIALAQASLRRGVRQMDLIRTPENESNASSLPARLDLFTTCDAEQTVQAIDAPCWANEVAVLNTIQMYDAILHISEQPMLARARLLNKLCVEQRKTFIQAIVVDGHVWIGPLVCPESGACWECAWRRLQSNLMPEQASRYEFHDQPAASSGQLYAMPAATIAAHRLIFELFRYHTRDELTKNAGNLIAIDLATCLSESHSFLPHPHCQACHHPVIPTEAHFLEQIQQLEHREPINQDTLLANMARCIDTRTGLFTAVDDDDFVQVPLAVYKVHLSNPMWECQREDRTVVAVGTDTTSARLRAFQQACERYVTSLVDRRRLLSFEAVQQHSLPAISADQLVGTQPLCAESETLWTWALDLHTLQASLVPATPIFSTLQEQERGVASGMIWEDALCRALLDWSQYLTIGPLDDAQALYDQVDLARTTMTPEGAYLYHLLQTVVGQITVYDVTGPLQVPTFATCVDERVVAYSTHCDGAQALSMGFEQALQQYQSTLCQQPEYMVAPVPDLPSAMRSTQSRVPHSNVSESWSGRLDWLLQKFQMNGFHAFAIPLDYDLALAQMLPYIVRVLLVKA